jgi:2-dehydro-3-deoxygluconokinase
MMQTPYDAIGIGTCYVDTLANGFEFEIETGIPVDTELIGQSYEDVAGGSAVNACRALGALGLRTAFIGIVGDDPRGVMLEQLLRRDGVEPLLVRRSGLQTNISWNKANLTGQHQQDVVGSANSALAPETVRPALQRVIGNSRSVIIGGAYKLDNLVGAADFKDIVSLIRTRGAALIVDPNRPPSGMSTHMEKSVRKLILAADYYLPNASEVCKLWGVSDPGEAIQLLHSMQPNLTVVVKDGASGAYYRSESGAIETIKPPQVTHVINATGAGDSFNGGLVAATLGGAALPEAIGYACRVAAAKISGGVLPKFRM